MLDKAMQNMHWPVSFRCNLPPIWRAGAESLAAHSAQERTILDIYFTSTPLLNY